MLRIIGRITPRSGAVDIDPGQAIFGGASSPVIRQNKNITVRKIAHPFHGCTPFFTYGYTYFGVTASIQFLFNLHKSLKEWVILHNI